MIAKTAPLSSFEPLGESLINSIIFPLDQNTILKPYECGADMEVPIFRKFVIIIGEFKGYLVGAFGQFGLCTENFR